MADSKLREGTINQLPDEVSRSLVYVSGRSGIQLKPFDPGIVANQAHFGCPESDLTAMFIAHNVAAIGETILGIREETKRRYDLVFADGETEAVLSKDSEVATTWFGENVKIMARDEAGKTEYAGQTALKWATVGEVVPDAVVRARNGYFYPASPNDKAVSVKHR